VNVGGDYLEVFEFGIVDGVLDIDLPGQHLIDGVLDLCLDETETRGRIPLWVRIDDEDPFSFYRAAGREIDGGGGLADPALLVDDTDDLCHIITL